MQAYPEVAASLTRSLSLQDSPVAISFTDTAPEGLPSPADLPPAGCRFWQDAAARSFVTSAEHHRLCAIGTYTHNLQTTPGQQTDLNDALQVFGDLGYVRPEDIPSIPVLRAQFRYVVYAPLAEASLPADVVLLFVDAAQTLILSEAASQLEDRNAMAMGRPACAVIPEVINSGRPALSLGCCGARAYLDILTPGNAIFAIPGAKIEAYAQRVEVLAKANGVLSQFHLLRRRAVEAGETPSVMESVAALSA
jgi:uncharacterized protein (DUF169 family)